MTRYALRATTSKSTQPRCRGSPRRRILGGGEHELESGVTVAPLEEYEARFGKPTPASLRPQAL